MADLPLFQMILAALSLTFFISTSRMLKKSAGFVLAARRGSTYERKYASPPALAAAALDGVF